MAPWGGLVSGLVTGLTTEEGYRSSLSAWTLVDLFSLSECGVKIFSHAYVMQKMTKQLIGDNSKEYPKLPNCSTRSFSFRSLASGSPTTENFTSEMICDSGPNSDAACNGFTSTQVEYENAVN